MKNLRTQARHTELKEDLPSFTFKSSDDAVLVYSQWANCGEERCSQEDGML